VEYKHIFLPLLQLVSKILCNLHYITLKKYVCIPRSFLVIKVCNEGNTLCSPCTYVNSQSLQSNFQRHSPQFKARTGTILNRSVMKLILKKHCIFLLPS